MVRIPTTERQFYNVPSKVNTLEVFSKALMPAAQTYRETVMNQQKVKIDTKSTQARVEADKFVQDMRLKHQANPDSAEARQEMQNGLNEIWQRYGQDIDPIAKGQWDLTVSKLNGAYEIANNQWAFKQREENTKVDVADNMNTNYQLAFEYGQAGNINGAIAELGVSFDQLNNYATKNLGGTVSKQLMKDYKKQFIKNFIDGQMQSNPSAALQSLENKEIAKEIDNQKELSEMKEYAVNRLANVKRQAKYKELVNASLVGGSLLNRSLTDNLSLEQIQLAMPKNASESYKSLIYSLNGYGKKKNSKLSNYDKAIGTEKVYEELASVMSNENSTPESYAKLQNDVYTAMENGSMTQAAGTKVLNELIMPMQKKWEGALEKLSADEKGWRTGDVGAEGIKQFMEKSGRISKTKSEDKAINKQIQAANARNMIEAYQMFYQELQNEVNNDPDYTDISDVAMETNQVKKRDILRKAQQNTIQKLNQQKYSFLAGYTEEKQPNSVLDNGQLVKNTDNMNNAKQGTPIKGTISQVATSGGKYYARYSDGSFGEISRQTYLQNGGK